jgi:hypothetical protein
MRKSSDIRDISAYPAIRDGNSPTPIPLAELTLMPHIARQIQSDVVVSAAAGRRIDEHLGQWPAQASREPVIPDRPEVALEATSTDTSH